MIRTYSSLDEIEDAMTPQYGPAYDRAMARVTTPRTKRLALNWKRETKNFQVFEEVRTPTWNGVLYLPNDILRVGREFGEIEIIMGARKRHDCNCPDCHHPNK